MTSRRSFLAGLATLALPRLSWADAGSPVCLAAARTAAGHALHGIDRFGQNLFALPLPARGHAAAGHPTEALAVAFARRPGTFALVIDCVRGVEIARLTPPEGRQFNGHGAFSADGAILYTSEVVARTSEGRIGLWDGETLARIGEWASGGIGPHDVKRTPDGGLIIANGGIVTDPADRTKLNIASMRPNLTQLGADGGILAQADLAGMAQNSIRHLALAGNGGVAFAMQWEGDPADTVPFLGLWPAGKAPILCPAPETEAPRMRGYAGSIARSAEGEIAITSPKGGVVQVFDADGLFLATHERGDICGIAAAPAGGFLATDGTGGVLALTSRGISPLARCAVAWDNHLIALDHGPA